MNFWAFLEERSRPAYTGPNGPEWPPMWVDASAQILEEIRPTRDEFDWTRTELDWAARLARLLVQDRRPAMRPNAIAHRIKRNERTLVNTDQEKNWGEK